MWWLIGGGGVLAVGAPFVARWLKGWRYDWARARHLLLVTEQEPVAAPEYGLMILAEEQRIMLPRLGAHVRLWGSGHSCDSDGPHEGECVCECGITAPYDDEPSEAEVAASRAAHGYIPELDTDHVMEDVPGSHSGLHHSWSCWCLHDSGPVERGPSLAPSGPVLDSGPGVPADLSSAPGPDQDSPALVMAPPNSGVEDGIEWAVNAMFKPPIRAGEPGPDVERLSWLDQQFAGHLAWARLMRSQVTGWGLAA